MFIRKLTSVDSLSIALACVLAAASASTLRGAAVTTAAGTVDGVWTENFTAHGITGDSYGFNNNIGANNAVVQSGSVTDGNSYAGSTYSAWANSSATVGALHAATGGTLSNMPSGMSGSTFSSKAVAHFADTLTITSTSVANGQLGYVSLDISVDGMNTWTANAFASSYIDVKIGTNSFQSIGVPFGNGVNEFTVLSTGLKAIAFGQVNIIIDLYTSAYYCVPCTGTLGATIQASSNFSNTATLTGATVYNGSQEAVEATITGDPGFDYTTFSAVSSVPEPGTLGLLAAGLAGLAWFRSRRKS